MITKEKFESYRRVQYSGMYNMIMQAREAMVAAGLNKEDYWDIIKNYNKYYEKFMND